MSTVYAWAKQTYRMLVPARAHRMLLSRRSPLRAPLLRMRKRMEASASHDDIYDEQYYAKVDAWMVRSASVIAETVVREFAPRSVLDVGCGTGALLAKLHELGVDGQGLEYSAAALERCRERRLDVKRFDLEHDSGFETNVDVAISTEVAEHLPAEIADRFVDLLCGSAPIVIMTAATPGQGGTDHVNEQPHEYWIEKFVTRGMMLDLERSLRWRKEWKEAGLVWFYTDNVMIFRREPQSRSASAKRDE
jgi:SAM-dependent methyltransferase